MYRVISRLTSEEHDQLSQAGHRLTSKWGVKRINMSLMSNFPSQSNWAYEMSLPAPAAKDLLTLRYHLSPQDSQKVIDQITQNVPNLIKNAAIAFGGVVAITGLITKKLSKSLWVGAAGGILGAIGTELALMNKIHQAFPQLPFNMFRRWPALPSSKVSLNSYQ